MESLLKSRKFEVFRKDVKGHRFEFVKHPGSVVILPLVDDQHCLMLRQFRPALDRETWELPAGTMDKPGEDPLTTAKRELEEETGRIASRLDYLCEFYPSPGFLDELVQAYVARDLKEGKQHLDATEQVLAVEVRSLSEVLAMIHQGEIQDAKTIICLTRYAKL